MKMSISDQLVHVTLRIECVKANGERSTGTGFIMRFCDTGNGFVPTLITNKHVISGAVSGEVHMHIANEQDEPVHGSYATVTITDFEKRFIPHPDPSVDLAAWPINDLLDQCRLNGAVPYYKSIGVDFISSVDELKTYSAVEDILMIGYPNGLWDDANNFPIARRGVTATPPYADFKGKKDFVIDCACYPGSSGSPIFLYNIGSYSRKEGGTQIGHRVKLLGILYEGPLRTETGEIRVVPVPTSTKPISVSNTLFNLGYCVKATQLLFFEKHIQDVLSKNDPSSGPTGRPTA